jgi:phage-related holin
MIESATTTWLKSLTANVVSGWQQKALMGAAFSVFTFLFDGTLVRSAGGALVMLILLDTITALVAAKKNGTEIQSRKMLRTVWKILIYFTAVSAGHQVEIAANYHETSNIFLDLTVGSIEEYVLTFLAITEFTSVLENIGRAGYAIPLKLLNKLEDYKDSR